MSALHACVCADCVTCVYQQKCHRRTCLVIGQFRFSRHDRKFHPFPPHFLDNEESCRGCPGVQNDSLSEICSKNVFPVHTFAKSFQKVGRVAKVRKLKTENPCFWELSRLLQRQNGLNSPKPDFKHLFVPETRGCKPKQHPTPKAETHAK